MSEPIPPNAEIERQYRVLRQTMDAHGFLRDRNARLARLFQISLLVCSVMFCATTFASDEFYTWLGCGPGPGKFLRGAASVIAFAFSVTLLTVDFKGQAALHDAAVARWSRALVDFRRVQPEKDREWPEDLRRHLSETYWSADKESINIPNRSFLALKAKHLRKTEISKIKSKHPGCPTFLIALAIRVRDTSRFWREFRHGGDKPTNAAAASEGQRPQAG